MPSLRQLIIQGEAYIKEMKAFVEDEVPTKTHWNDIEHWHKSCLKMIDRIDASALSDAGQFNEWSPRGEIYAAQRATVEVLNRLADSDAG